MTTPISDLRNCESQCFVARDENGKVTQGCGICPLNSKNKDCVNCKERYCNEERLVPKHCWINDKEICKTEYDTPCFTERTLNNQINKAVGNVQVLLHVNNAKIIAVILKKNSLIFVKALMETRNVLNLIVLFRKVDCGSSV
uniref:Uncharacterized protein n=1 Tax=Meloidogyne enterolobii TaxID=390850 RepID=A0A6V7VJS5_MELEN|nr:unnamed protein product [Meloidogyne enterolobii]